MHTMTVTFDKFPTTMTQTRQEAVTTTTVRNRRLKAVNEMMCLCQCFSNGHILRCHISTAVHLGNNADRCSSDGCTSRQSVVTESQSVLPQNAAQRRNFLLLCVTVNPKLGKLLLDRCSAPTLVLEATVSKNTHGLYNTCEIKYIIKRHRLSTSEI